MIFDSVRFSFPSHILIIIRRTKQRFHFDRLIVFKVRPEEVHPVPSLGFEYAKESTFKEIDEVFEHATIEGTFSTFSDEVTIPENLNRLKI